MSRKKPDKKPVENSNTRAIDARRLALRGGRSVRQVSRDQTELDRRENNFGSVRNRMSWARRPWEPVERIKGRTVA